MDCNVCERPEAEVTRLEYKNGDTYEMYLCEPCTVRLTHDTTVHRVQQLQSR